MPVRPAMSPTFRRVRALTVALGRSARRLSGVLPSPGAAASAWSASPVIVFGFHWRSPARYGALALMFRWTSPWSKHVRYQSF